MAPIGARSNNRQAMKAILAALCAALALSALPGCDATTAGVQVQSPSPFPYNSPWEMADEPAAGYLDARIDALREHLAALAAAVPQLPAAFAGVQDQLMLEWQGRGRGGGLGLVAAVLLLRVSA